jgi:hypothetical protein
MTESHHETRLDKSKPFSNSGVISVGLSAGSQSHSRESWNPLRKLRKMRCLWTGFPPFAKLRASLSRE